MALAKSNAWDWRPGIYTAQSRYQSGFFMRSVQFPLMSGWAGSRKAGRFRISRYANLFSPAPVIGVTFVGLLPTKYGDSHV